MRIWFQLINVLDERKEYQGEGIQLHPSLGKRVGWEIATWIRVRLLLDAVLCVVVDVYEMKEKNRISDTEWVVGIVLFV